jgi:DNA-binding NtrC family response regulator
VPSPPVTVLVVDDEPSLRLLCRVNLELEGFRVLEAATLDEARAHASDGVDVVLLDVHVGNELGLGLIDELADLEPAPRVVLFSGTSEIDPATRARVDAVLGKPFQLDALVSTVGGLVVDRT